LADLPWRFPTDLSPDDIDIIRQVLYPNLVITHNNRPVGTADIAQELAALEGLHDVGSRPEEEELPEQGRAVAVNPAVRLVRGVVGSGKTLVLVMRAKNLADAYPDWRLLVVTFNRPLSDDLQTRFDGYEDRVTVTNFHRLCRRLLSGVNEWSGKPIDDRRGRIANIVNTQFEIPRLEADFLDEEIKWIKEMGLRDKARYMSEPRIGRGRPLGQADREFVWAVYERYQSMLADFHRFDWEDVPLMVLKAMEYGMLRGQAYDAILIDEAQDFAPAWFEVLRRQLNPQTAVMFLSADGVQRIYRKHSWRSLGLNVVGRTRILNRSYRSTYEIARVAVHLLRSDADVMSALEAEGEELPPTQLDPAWMRHGEPPELRFFPNGRKEKQWIENRLRALLGQGYRPDDIALFHYTKDGRNGLAAAVQQAGLPVRVLSGNSPPVPGAITVGTMHAAKGLEFRVVLLPQLQALFFGGRMPTTVEQATREQAEKLRLLYVALTRARELLYMSYEKALPPNLNAFVSFVRDQSREVGSV
jgi:superfamily I DNA/RNA helicase